MRAGSGRCEVRESAAREEHGSKLTLRVSGIAVAVQQNEVDRGIAPVHQLGNRRVIAGVADDPGFRRRDIIRNVVPEARVLITEIVSPAESIVWSCRPSGFRKIDDAWVKPESVNRRRSRVNQACSNRSIAEHG